MSSSHPTGSAPLDEVMLAMDVVDTIRHRELIVERELRSGERRADLQARLKALYAAQGIDVPEHVLVEGVAALEQDRFAYTPPTPGLRTSLAGLYVARSRWGKPLLAIAGIVAAALLGYELLVAGPREAQIARLPTALQTQYEATVAAARAPEAEERAAALLAAGQSAVASGAYPQAAQAADELAALRARLEQEYELTIVSRPGELSGVWRIPGDNANAQNFYVIVEALDSNGRALTLPVRNEEDGRTYQVARWGLRVDEETFGRLQADKRDDGIIQQSLAGRKRPGYLEPEYVIATTGGAITSW